MSVSLCKALWVELKNKKQTEPVTFGLFLKRGGGGGGDVGTLPLPFSLLWKKKMSVTEIQSRGF